MHIPDGYISPQTAGGLWALMVPVWYTAGHKAKKVLKARQAPLVAIGAAFTFVIMMFNIPVLGGTTGHAVGATLVAIVLGPWVAVISVTVALVIQAIFFGDGGILAIGANCFNMAFIAPVSGYFIYRLISAGAPVTGARRWIGAGIGSFAGINLAALMTAIEIGIQPGLFHTADGTALYSPYGLSQSIPAMMVAHLTIIGFIEGAVTALVVLYLQRSHAELLGGDSLPAERGERFRLKPFITGVFLMLVFVPLGLLATATAWGEWSPEDIQEELGFVPQGMERFAGMWSGLMPDYAFPSQAEAGFWASVPGYLTSGVIGLSVVVVLTYIVARLLARRVNNGGLNGNIEKSSISGSD